MRNCGFPEDFSGSCNRRPAPVELRERVRRTAALNGGGRVHLVASFREGDVKAMLLRGLDGDRAAYRAFLDALTELLRGYVRRQLVRAGHGDNEAEDIVQDVLIAIHERRHTYDREVPVTAWAHAIARYKVIDFLRARNASRRHVSLDAVEDYVGDDGAWMEVTSVLRRLLSVLPDRFRKPIELTKLHGFSASEAATQLGMSESAVKVNVHRGIKSLLRLVEDDR